MEAPSKVKLLSAIDILNNARQRIYAFESYNPESSDEPEEE